MTKSLSSYPEQERSKIADNRVMGKTGGIGYHAALDYFAAKLNKANKGKNGSKKDSA